MKQGKQWGMLEGWPLVSLDLETFEMGYEEEASERLRGKTKWDEWWTGGRLQAWAWKEEDKKKEGWTAVEKADTWAALKA